MLAGKAKYSSIFNYPSLTWADVYSTAAVVKGPLARHWIATLRRHAGFIVTAEGSAHVIPGNG